MPETSADRIRNVVLLSHSGAGKTVLSDAMLFTAGMITRIGKTEDGNTTSDYEAEEIRRQTSVQTAILATEWRDHKINLIDTPGYADFRAEVMSGIRVADGAIVVVSGPAAVEVGTRQMWELAEQRGLPRIVFVSKMDRENADFERVMASLEDALGRSCVAINLPIGAEADFSGTVNILDHDAEVPDGMQEEVKAFRDRLAEAVAEVDDDLATKYLEGEELTSEELIRGLKRGVSAGSIVPVLAGASPSEIGAREVLDAIVDFMPAPTAGAPAEATDPSNQGKVSLSPAGDSLLAALVFKTSADPFVGKLSLFRVYSGTLKSNSQVWNSAANEAERVAQVFVVRGKTQEPVDEIGPGDIGAVAKLTSVLTGHTLSEREHPLVFEGIEFPPAVYQMAVFPKTKSDLDKMTGALSRITEEDPSLVVSREPDTLEMLLGGLGDTHVEVAVERMKRKFGVEILLEVPKVPYMETINAITKVEYKHKKQTGGHGQYGHVFLELNPLPRGQGFEFESRVVGGSVPREYIPSVQKGVAKALDDGVVAGYPVVDLKATLVDGSFHPVDSSGICFEIAGGHALSKGMRQATPVLLEPIMRVEIVVPESYAGDVIGDLNSKRGRIQGMLPLGDGMTRVEAEIPRAMMLRYATDLRSQTQGRGSFSMEFDHYEEVPQHLVQRVVEEREKAEARA